MERMTQAIKHLIIINVIMFLITQLHLIPNFTELTAIWFIKNPNFHWWQFITHMFMHGGFMHIFFNMYALWAFGTPLENMWGRNKFLFFFFSCGIGAALIHMGVNYYYFEKGVQALVDGGVNQDTIFSLFAEGKYNTQWQTLIPQTTFSEYDGSLHGSCRWSIGSNLRSFSRFWNDVSRSQIDAYLSSCTH